MAGLPADNQETDLALGWRGLVDHPAGFTESRRFEDWNLWLVDQGRVEIVSGATGWQLGGGCAFLFTPDTEYRACFRADTRLGYCHFSLRDQAGRRLVARLGPAGLARPLALADPSLTELAGRLRAVIEGQRLAITRLKADLASLLLQEFPDLANAPLHPLPDIDARGRLLDYISRNCGRPIAVRELSALFGLSAHGFAAWLRANLGTTPRQLLTRTRMETGQLLLLQPGATVQQAARATGYLDEFAFAKAFKRHFGVAPGRFSRQARQETPSLETAPRES